MTADAGRVAYGTDLERGRLRFRVEGRPAPQGSKDRGSAGQMREASRYLPAWRAAVKKAVYETYRDLGVDKADLPLLRGPVAFACTFRVAPDQRVDSPPDLDKLVRAVWDALTAARVWEDDGRVVEVDWLRKTHATEQQPMGADITVRLAR